LTAFVPVGLLVVERFCAFGGRLLIDHFDAIAFSVQSAAVAIAAAVRLC